MAETQAIINASTRRRRWEAEISVNTAWYAAAFVGAAFAGKLPELDTVTRALHPQKGQEAEQPTQEEIDDYVEARKRALARIPDRKRP